MNQPTTNFTFLLADDLSGAMEAGAAFLRYDWRVKVLLSDEPPTSNQPFELAVFSTETRNDSPGDSAAKMRSSLRKLRAAGGRLIFKKIDSTARGAIAAELRVVCEELSPPLVLLTTANPATERAVRDGQVLVGGVPVEQTAFRDDPVWPVRTGDLRKMLQADGLACAGLSLNALRQDLDQTIMTLQAISRDGGRIVVCDAESENDLRQIVRAGRTVAKDVVFVGSGALAAVIAGLERCPLLRAANTGRVTVGSLLILCGSRHEASQRQLDRLARQAGLRVLEAVCDARDNEALLREVVVELRTQSIALVRFSVPESTGVEAARQILGCIRELGPQLLQAGQPGAVFLTGGETARAFCWAVGGRQLTLLGNLEPGIVIAELSLAGRQPFVIITKPGGYGDAETLIRVRQILHQA